jgi:hypothetical protein
VLSVFVNCNFWDTSILVPFTDQLIIGGDVLIVAGTVNMFLCAFTGTTGFANLGGVGLNVAVLGGMASFVGVAINQWGLALANYGLGTNFFVGGMCRTRLLIG